MRETENRKGTGSRSRTGRTARPARHYTAITCNICGVELLEPAKICNACMTFYRKKHQEDL